jgi:hypothetical protein
MLSSVVIVVNDKPQVVDVSLKEEDAVGLFHICLSQIFKNSLNTYHYFRCLETCMDPITYRIKPILTREQKLVCKFLWVDLTKKKTNRGEWKCKIDPSYVEVKATINNQRIHLSCVGCEDHPLQVIKQFKNYL